jgi:peroxiredoxin
MPTIERLWRAHRAQGLEVLGVSLDVASADLAGFLKKHGLTLPVAADARSEVASAFFVRGLPTTVVLDRQGRTVAVAIGPREWDSAAAHALVVALLAERAR